MNTTLDSYLDTMFKDLPHTAEVNRARTELRAMMEDSFHTKLANGTGETQALGQVIAEFGSIDELAPVLGLSTSTLQGNDQTPRYRTLELGEARDYLALKDRLGIRRGFAAALCVFSPATLLALLAWYGDSSVPVFVGFVVLFLLVGTAVGIFLMSDSSLTRFADIEKGHYEPQSDVRAYVSQELPRHATRKAVSHTIGIGIIFLGVVGIVGAGLAADSLYGEDSPGEQAMLLSAIAVFLLLTAISVWVFIAGETRHNVLESLLDPAGLRRAAEHGDSPDKSSSTVVRVLFAVLWPLAVIVFLVAGLGFNQWGTAWIVFVVAGVLTWLLTNISGALGKNRESSHDHR